MKLINMMRLEVMPVGLIFVYCDPITNSCPDKIVLEYVEFCVAMFFEEKEYKKMSAWHTSLN